MYAPRHFYGGLFVQNPSVSSCFGTCSKLEYFQKSYVHCTRERERAQHAAETAGHKQENLTKRRERDRAGRSTLTAAAGICISLAFSLLCICTLQTLCVAVMLAYATTTKFAHARPTMHCIRLVTD